MPDLSEALRPSRDGRFCIGFGWLVALFASGCAAAAGFSSTCSFTSWTPLEGSSGFGDSVVCEGAGGAAAVAAACEPLVAGGAESRAAAGAVGGCARCWLS